MRVLRIDRFRAIIYISNETKIVESVFVMEFNEKLQELRRQKNLTQEDLAQALYVSRTAISKWESGRGYPNIDSLKSIAKFFSISVDELLSSDELLTLAEADTKQKETRLRDLVFGLLDVSVVLFLFLPFFGQQVNGGVQSVSLLSLTEISAWLKIVYFVSVAGMAVWGLVLLALQNSHQIFLAQNKCKISLILSTIGTLLFIVSLQPYAAAFLFTYVIIKVLMLIKW